MLSSNCDRFEVKNRSNFQRLGIQVMNMPQGMPPHRKLSLLSIKLLWPRKRSQNQRNETTFKETRSAMSSTQGRKENSSTSYKSLKWQRDKCKNESVTAYERLGFTLAVEQYLSLRDL